jgi:hypothetical protein
MPKRRRGRYEPGDKVKFVHLLSDDHEKWYMSQKEFEVLIEYINKIGTITAVEKQYTKEDINYFIDVSFSSGYKISRANAIAFEKIDLDFDWI